MNAEIKTKWVEALLSRKYKQGTGRLRSEDNHFCCLGVLCDVLGKEWEEIPYGWACDGSLFGLPDFIRRQVGLSDSEVSELMRKNDMGIPFKNIAEYIKMDIPSNNALSDNR